MKYNRKEIVERIRAAESPEALGDIIADLILEIEKLESRLPTCHECGAHFVPPRTETSE